MYKGKNKMNGEKYTDFVEWINETSRIKSASSKKNYLSSLKWFIKAIEGDVDIWMRIVYNANEVVEKVIDTSERSLSSKKMTTEGIKWIIKWIMEKEFQSFVNEMNYGMNSNHYMLINSYKNMCQTLHTSLSVYRNYTDKINKKLHEKAISTQKTPEQEKRQKIGLKKLTRRWKKEWSKLMKEWKQNPDKFLEDANNKLRSSNSIWFERTIALGLFLNAPPRRSKDWTNMYLTDGKESLGEDSIKKNYLVGEITYDNNTKISVKNIYNTNFNAHKTAHMGYVKTITRVKGYTFEIVNGICDGGQFVKPTYWKCLSYMLNYRLRRNILEKKPHNNSKLFSIKKDMGREIKEYVINVLKWKPGIIIDDLRHMYITDFIKTSPTDLQKRVISSLMAHSVNEQSKYNIPQPPPTCMIISSDDEN